MMDFQTIFVLIVCSLAGFFFGRKVERRRIRDRADPPPVAADDLLKLLRVTYGYEDCAGGGPLSVLMDGFVDYIKKRALIDFSTARRSYYSDATERIRAVLRRGDLEVVQDLFRRLSVHLRDDGLVLETAIEKDSDS